MRRRLVRTPGIAALRRSASVSREPTGNVSCLVVVAGWFVLAGILTLSAYLNVRAALIADSSTEQIQRALLAFVILGLAALALRKGLRDKGQ